MEGSSLVLEKNDSEDCCGDQEERSSDIVFVIFDILGIYCHYADIKIKIKISQAREIELRHFKSVKPST